MASKSMKLYPISDESHKRVNFGVCDIESMKWIQFLCIGFFDGSNFLWWKKRSEMFEYIFEYMKDEDWDEYTVYAHFGGKFDFQFLFDELCFRMPLDYVISDMIQRGSGLLCFSVTYGNRKIIFRDSSAMLPFGLKSLCENFKVDHPKMDWDHEKTTGVTPELVKYLEFDCKGLHECITKYFNWPLIKKAGPSHTIASQAIRVLRTFLDFPIHSLPDDEKDPRYNVDEFVRESYFGGRTEIFKPFFDGNKNTKKLYCYDVNSLYPTVMRLNEFPKKFSHFTRVYHPEKLGVYDAEVEVPADMYIPPLPVVSKIGDEEKLIFPTGRFKGRWTTWEIEYARSVGVKIISIGRGAIFQSGGKFFKPFVDALYEIRENSVKDSVDNVLAKLLLNSCYGRFGLIKDRQEVVFDEGQVGFLPMMEIGRGKKVYRLGTMDKRIECFTNVAIAAFVTSAARIYMHKIYLKCRGRIWYTDTDSLFTDSLLKVDEKGLGGLKLEYSCDAAVFLLPKTYVITDKEEKFKILNEKGKKISSKKKVVMKGFDRKKINHFGVDDFFMALEGDLRRMIADQPAKFATFKTAAKKQKFLALLDEGSRQVNSLYSKRTLVKTGDDFDTFPLHIVDGKPVIIKSDSQKKWDKIRKSKEWKDRKVKAPHYEQYY